MHQLQPKQTKLNEKESASLLSKYNISASQLPKINKKDPSLPEGVKEGDIIKIERKNQEGKEEYYRVVI
jgi:DNA-directed RNA polymerase subunit H (RpoH/RPB5)